MPSLAFCAASSMMPTNQVKDTLFYQAAKLLQDKNAQFEVRIHEECFLPELVFGSGSSSQCCGDEAARSLDFFWLKPEQTFANFDYTIGIYYSLPVQYMH